MSLGDLSAALFADRELLEEFCYALEVEQLILAAGRTEWLPRAAAAAEQVRDRLAAEDLSRAVAAQVVCDELGLPADASLRDIAAAAPAPWNEVIAAHHQELRALLTRIQAVAKDNQEDLRAKSRMAQETLASLASDVGLYTPSGAGASATATGSAHLLDRAL